MDYITTKYKSTIHLDSIKTKIEDIVNIIAKELCLNHYLNVEQIETKIQEKYQDYKNLCTIASSTANTCDSNDQIIFNRDRLQNIMTQMKNNRDFVRMCKFKYNVISGIPQYKNISLNTIIYSLSGPQSYTIMPNGIIPIITPTYFKLAPYNVHMFGGELDKVNDNEISKIIDVDTVKSVKLVDFDEFEKEFESKVLTLSSMTISDKTSDCKYLSNDITNTYKMLKQIEKSDDANTIIDVIDEIESLLEVLKYCVVSIDTYKEYHLIKHDN